jgi:antitoxin HicB
MEAMNSNNPHIGSSLEDWLEEEGLLEDATNFAIKSVLAWQVGQFMQNNQLTKTAMAKRMSTSRAALDRLLNPENESVTLKTLQNAARAVGARVELNLVFTEKAA